MCTFEEIKKANESIITTGIEKKDKKTGKVTTKEYAEVNQRIKAFRMVHPNGAIETSMISLCDGVAVFKATVRNEEGNVLGTGTAYEKEGSSFINQSSFIENCETSAVGRALAVCGYGIDFSIASYEEVANAKANQGDTVLPLINEPKETKKKEAAPKVEAEVVEEEAKIEKAYPSREDMLKVVYKHYPVGTKSFDSILSFFGTDSVEDATDAQLAAIYNKFGGK